MPLGQFDERDQFISPALIDDSIAPNTPNSVGFANNRDCRVDVWQLSNSDTITHTVGLSMNNSINNGFIVQVSVPARTGHDGNPPLDLIAAAFPTAFHYLQVPAGQDYFVWVEVAMQTGTFIQLFASGGYF